MIYRFANKSDHKHVCCLLFSANKLNVKIVDSTGPLVQQSERHQRIYKITSLLPVSHHVKNFSPIHFIFVVLHVLIIVFSSNGA